MEILLIEPSRELTDSVRRRLNEEGYTAVCVSNGTDALKLLDSLRFESILLEWSLPDMNGVDVLRELRTRRLDTPVMVLSTRACVADRVLALDSGADDYLLRPFHLDECMARVRRMVRTYHRHIPESSGDGSGGIQCIADLTVDLTQHVATRSGKRLLLSAKESAILEYFAQHAGKILTRAEIEAHIAVQDSGSGLVPVYIHYLRQKIDEGYPLPLLHTVRGKGYMLSANPMRKPRRCFRPVACAV